MVRYSALVFVCILLATRIVLAQGAVTGASALQIVSDHPHHVILARVLRIGDGGHAVTLAHWPDGVHYPRLDAVYLDEAALPFERLPRRPACLSPGRCPARTLGLVMLPDAAARAGSQAGLTLRLHGSIGIVTVVLPPDLFAEAESPV